MAHNKSIENPDPICSVYMTEFICHICLMTMKLNAGLKSHVRGHGCHSETEVFTNNAKGWEIVLIHGRWSNCHEYLYIYI